MADRFWSGVGISTGAAGEAAGEATEKYKELQKALEDVYQSAIGRQLLESGFDGVEANLLSAFGENGFNRDAFFSQLDTLRNAGVSSNFFGQYPGLEEAIANYSHAYDLNEGEEGFSEKARLEADKLHSRGDHSLKDSFTNLLEIKRLKKEIAEEEEKWNQKPSPESL